LFSQLYYFEKNIKIIKGEVLNKMSFYKKWNNMSLIEPILQNSYEIMEVQNREHREKLIKKNSILCIDIYADWCEPCKEILPKFSNLAQKVSGIAMCVKENLSNSTQDLTTNYNIHSVPTFLLFYRGHIYKIYEGADSLPVVEREIERLNLQYQTPEAEPANFKFGKKATNNYSKNNT